MNLQHVHAETDSKGARTSVSEKATVAVLVDGRQCSVIGNIAVFVKMNDYYEEKSRS